MAWEYTEKTKQLFIDAMSGKEGTHLGEIEDADAVGVNGSIVCGDALKLSFKVKKDKKDPLKDIITEIKYQTFGCTSAIASSEALCAIIEEKQCSPIEALKIRNQDIVDFLGGLPSQKIHCSVMGEQALKAAVKNWAHKRGVDLTKLGIITYEEEHEDDEGRVVCECYNITEPFLKRKIKELNLKTVEEVTNATKAGGACGTCHDRLGGIKDILKEIWQEEDTSIKQEEMSCDFVSQIQKVVKEKIRPALKAHGGNINIVDIRGTKVYCTLEGSCSSCPGAKHTIKNTVEKQLREEVHPDIVVIDL